MASRSLRLRSGPRLQSIFLDTLRTRPLPSTLAYVYHAKLATPRRTISSHRSAFAPSSILRAATSFKPTYRKNATSAAAAPAAAASTSSMNASAPTPSQSATADLTAGFNDPPALNLSEDPSQPVDWTRSFHGLSVEPFSKEIADVLLAPISEADVEIKPDGILYLPEIKYRRILQKAFGPGGWGLAPRGETIVTGKSVTREYALVAHGRLISISRGEQDYFSPEGIPTAAEGCKSNAMMRCCKDLGIASELWDPRWIQQFMAKHAKEVFVEHTVTKKKKKIFLRKEDVAKYPFKETKGF